MKNAIASSCENSLMLTSCIIDLDLGSDYSLNEFLSLGPIPCFHFCTIMLYIRKVIMAKNTMSDLR